MMHVMHLPPIQAPVSKHEFMAVLRISMVAINGYFRTTIVRGIHMPRKQRFKPNRKPKPANQEMQAPMADPASRVNGSDDRRSGPPESGRHEVSSDGGVRVGED